MDKKDKTKLTPLPVDASKMFCTFVMFTRFVLSIFPAHEFPESKKKILDKYMWMYLVVILLSCMESS